MGQHRMRAAALLVEAERLFRSASDMVATAAHHAHTTDTVLTGAQIGALNDLATLLDQLGPAWAAARSAVKPSPTTASPRTDHALV